MIDFNPDESLSFSQWLKLTKMQPIEREPNILNAENILQEQEAINDRENKFKIIDTRGIPIKEKSHKLKSVIIYIEKVDE